MAVVRLIGGIYRVVDSESEMPVMREGGGAVDGGGHESRSDAQDQADAINAAIRNSMG